MDKPIKVIHKYKNQKRRVQYHLFVFIGNIQPAEIYTILDKIKNLDLFDTLVELDNKEYTALEKEYGEFWYRHFFLIEHIVSIFSTLIGNRTKYDVLETKYGKEWMTKHYEKTKEENVRDYETFIKQAKERSNVKASFKYATSSDEIIDYHIRTESRGGQENFNNGEEEYFPIGQEEDEDIRNQEVDELFQQLNEVDNNVNKTITELKQVIGSDEYNKKKDVLEFDTSNDNINFDASLRNIYKKEYVINQYIYLDDTIRNIGRKICCSFKNSPIYGSNAFIVPKYQYLWTNYYYGGEIKKIMLGQKWIFQNEILSIDIEPQNDLGYYELLYGNLKSLKESLKQQSKLKRDNDDNVLLAKYLDFLSSNEIYMMDIINDLGPGYDPKDNELRNLFDVYITIYYNKIPFDELKSIIDFLNSLENEEKRASFGERLLPIYEDLNNNLLLENEVINTIEVTKKYHMTEVNSYFLDNYIIYAIVRVYISKAYRKLDVFRIFDNYLTSIDFPFVQIQSADGIVKYKYNNAILSSLETRKHLIKWFDNTTHGLNFRVKSGSGKYFSVNLTENGRIDYKIQWKEEERFTVDDIIGTYMYIVALIEKLIDENNEPSLIIPANNDFQFAFMNTIQKFQLPDENITINHNELSDFARFFFPYVATVIEPKKRVTKYDIPTKGKYGTYLRYKRIDNYENRNKIEHRIIFLLKNVDYNDQTLSTHISNEFNITEQQAFDEINRIRSQLPDLKKTRKVLKKIETVMRIKSPGIDIHVQGKSRDRYKVRISGARSKFQLERISTFMKLLIYLYVETYVYQKPERQVIKTKLKLLTNIARRKNKVDEIIQRSDEVNALKSARINDERLDYKAKYNLVQYPRGCQNSAVDRRRQPQQILSEEELMSKGYVWKDTLDGYDLGHYERTVTITDENGQKRDVTLKALRFQVESGDYIYYVCSPEENLRQIYVGVLSKMKNPEGKSLPCCFIKDHLRSKNPEIRREYLRNMGLNVEAEETLRSSLVDLSYIIQDGNRIHENRLGYLPKYLDILFNYLSNNSKIVNNNYLVRTDRYFVKYGVRISDNIYLNCLEIILGIKVDQIKRMMIDRIQEDDDRLFTFLRSGEIRKRYHTRDNFINFLRTGNNILPYHINDIVTLPGLFFPNGMNIIIFERKISHAKRTLEKKQIKEKYFISCVSSEDITSNQNLERNTAIIIHDVDNYYPVVMIQKFNEKEKHIDLTKMFKYTDQSDNIVKNIIDYHLVNCKSNLYTLIKRKSDGLYTAKEIVQSFPDLNITHQVLDANFKCIFLIVNDTIIVTHPSESLYQIEIRYDITEFMTDYTTTIQQLTKLHSNVQGRLQTLPIGFYYDKMNGKKIHIFGIITQNRDLVPIKQEWMDVTVVKKMKMSMEKRPNEFQINEAILHGKYNIDRRIQSTSKHRYDEDIYQIFRLHVSYYLLNNSSVKKLIVDTINDDSMNQSNKRIVLKRIFYQINDAYLAKIFSEIVHGGIIDMMSTIPMVNIVDEIDYLQTKIPNNRALCYPRNKITCEDLSYCSWMNERCSMNVTRIDLVKMINKIVSELLSSGHKANELLQDGAYVDTIASYNIFKELPNETILVDSDGKLLNNLPHLIFEEENPGPRSLRVPRDIPEYDKLNNENRIRMYFGWYHQKIINADIFRAFANCYFWLSTPIMDIQYRNLGYYSRTQTILSIFFKSQVIDWINERKKIEGRDKYQKLINNIYNNIVTEGIDELNILSTIHDIHVIVYNENHKIVYQIGDQLKTDRIIHLKFHGIPSPHTIEALYPK